MPTTEDNSTSIPTGESLKTPEGPFEVGSADTKYAGDRNGNRFVLPPTAPKGKPRAPPLIHGKIKPSEADMDMTSESSRIPLLKSKQVDSELLTGADDRKKQRHQQSSSSMGNRSNRSFNSDGGNGRTSTMHVHRTVEKVKVSKGIEMKRVVQETNGIKPKKISTTTTVLAKTKSGVSSTKESSHHAATATSPHRRKMTKTEASFAGDVKSFMPHRMDPPIPNGSSSSLTNIKSKITATNKHEHIIEQTPSTEKPAAAEQEAPQPVENDYPQVTSMDVGDFKTVDEFLKMPETCFPKAHSPDGKKKPIYKSKFWEYIDNKNPPPSKGSKGKEKPYDPEAVKTFMQKQKEVRRQQHLKETREREEESAKRQRMLKQLENKYQRQRMLRELESRYQRQQKDHIQIQKSKQHQRDRRGDGSVVISEISVNLVAEKSSENVAGIKTTKLETQSPSMKYLKPLLDRKHSTLLTMRKSSESHSLDVAKQSQYLLAEFENIVKRECISFLQKIPIPPTTPGSNTNNMETDGAVKKVDKAVATSSSLLDLATWSPAGSESQSVAKKSGSTIGSLSGKEWSSKDFQSMEDDMEVKRPPSRRRVSSPSTVEKAITKIQAVYRGYKVRQALKEANLCFPRKPAMHKRCSQLQNSNRRWSFPKLPEKPYAENLSSRLTPMSPIPMMGISSDSAVPCYIPPPSPAGSTGSVSQRSPSKPRVIPAFPLTPVRFRYNDPYPKSATAEKTSASFLDSVNANENSQNTQNLPPNSSFVTIRPKQGEDQEPLVPFENLAPKNYATSDFEFAVPSSLPSIVDVLREKIRLFQQQSSNENVGVAPALPQEQKSGLLWKAPAGDISISSQEESITPKIKKHKRRSRPRSQSQSVKSPLADSSTTLDTDGEHVVPATTRSSGSIRATKRSHHHHVSSNGSKSEETISSIGGSGPASSTTFDDATCTTSTFGNYLEPALRLRYEAERERLKTIEKALQVRLEGKAEEHSTASKKPSPPEVDRVQLAIANCHKESMKAAAEMAKWMSEFQKTSREPAPQQQQQQQQTVTPVDLAATVYAAVEQARIMGIEKRREKEKKTLQHHHRKQKLPDSTGTGESDTSEMQNKVDKSCETSLILVRGPVGDKGKKSGGLSINLKDYQQQFPSESERDSPALIVADVTAATNVQVAARPSGSPVPPPRPPPPMDDEEEDNTSKSKFLHDPIDYPSIIPSGNSIEFTSFDPKVSTLEYISQLSTEEKEFEGEDGDADLGDDTFVEEEELISSSVPKEDEAGGSLTSRQSTIPDEVLSHSQQQSKSESGLLPEEDFSKEEIDHEVSQAESLHVPEEEEDEDDMSAEIPDNLVVEDKATETEPLEDDSEENESVSNKHIYSDVKIKTADELCVKSPPSEDVDNTKASTIEMGEPSEKEGTPKDEKEEEPLSIIDDLAQDEDEEDQYEEDESHEEEKSMKNSNKDNVGGSVIEAEEKDFYEDKLEEDVTATTTEQSKIPEEEETEIPSVAEVVEEHEEEMGVSVEESSTSLKSNISLAVTTEPEAPFMKSPPPYLPLFKEKDMMDTRDQEEKEPQEISSTKEVLPIIDDLAEDDDDDDEYGEEESHEEENSMKNPNEHVVGGDSVVEAVEDDGEEGSQEEENSMQKPNKDVGGSSGVIEAEEDDDFYEDKFEEDVTATTTEQSKIPEEEETEIPSVAEVVEEHEEEMGVSVEESSPPSKSNSSFAVTPEVPFMKPPPPYSSLFKEKDMDTRDQEEEEPQEISSAKEVSQPSSGAQSSQIIDEASVAEEEEVEDEEEPVSSDKSSASQEASGAEKTKLPPADVEAATTLVTTEGKSAEYEVPLKPPPPYYSPSSSLESTSLSSRSLMISLHQDKLEGIARIQADFIWEQHSASTPGQFPELQTIMATITEKNVANVQGTEGANQAAEQSFDVLLCHLIYETMKEVILMDNKYTSFVEKVRPGPLALQARKLKVPKTKEALVDVVLKRVIKTIPQQFFGDSPQLPEVSLGGGGSGSRLRKWCSRPRELVDEILLEELIEEDYQWTEWWPEEVIVQNIVSTKIIQRLIKNALKNRKYVYSQSEQSQSQDQK